jgi:hypothetical protein
MPAMQVRANQVQDATTDQLEAMRARSRELRLRTSDLSAREQQLRETRYQTPAGPERAQMDRQWMSARHDLAAAQIELEGLNERISELRIQRDQARTLTLRPPTVPELPPVEAPGLANAGFSMLILFMAPVVLILVYRLFTRGRARDGSSLDASARLQRMEQAIESIAMDVERIAEGQRFTTRILAERHPDSASRAQVVADSERGAIAPRG